MTTDVRIMGAGTAAAGVGTVAFNFTGVLVTSVSPIFIPPVNITFNHFVANVAVSGSTSTVVQIIRDGVSVGTLTVAAGANISNIVTVAVALSAGVDELQFQITSAGTGAADLVCVAGP